jgi:hypothetical protein
MNGYCTVTIQTQIGPRYSKLSSMFSPIYLLRNCSHLDYLHFPNWTTTNQILSGHIPKIYIISNVTKNGKIEGCGFILVMTKYKNKHDSLNDKYVPHLVLIHSFLLKTVIGYGVFQIPRYCSYLLVIKLNAFCVFFFFSLKQYIRDVISNPEVLQLN